jgi:hypothetical protein
MLPLTNYKKLVSSSGSPLKTEYKSEINCFIENPKMCYAYLKSKLIYQSLWAGEENKII